MSRDSYVDPVRFSTTGSKGSLNYYPETQKHFEDQYKMVRVKSVWLIKKSRSNDGFQRWHRDFYLSTKIVTTIVVNVGVFDIVWSDDSCDDSTSSS